MCNSYTPEYLNYRLNRTVIYPRFSCVIQNYTVYLAWLKFLNILSTKQATIAYVTEKHMSEPGDNIKCHMVKGLVS